MKDMVQVRRGPRKSYEGPDARIGRSQFNRSHGLKMSFDASYLYPIMVDEVLPGDTFTCKLNGFARIFSPLDAPVMDNIELQTFFFFVPTRLVWENWEAFNGAHDSAGAQDTTYTVPIINDILVDHDSVVTAHGLAAYFGLPEGLDGSAINVSALPFRCYNKIYSEWFRDQNLTGEPTLNTGNGPDSASQYVIKKTYKKHDYFTSALPYLQKGTAITAAVVIAGDPATGQDFPTFQTPSGGSGTMTVTPLVTASATQTSNVYIKGGTGTPAVDENMAWDDPNLLGTIDVNALRQSVAIQRLLERDARGGTRYVELIKTHFGVTSPDFRLQRAEYLGGGKTFVNISPVANTSATATEDQAELKGIGTGMISGHGWAKSFTEHGYIIGLIRARGDITYFQGLDKLWSRSTRYDFYIPALANLGEQSIRNKEIFVSNDSNDDNVFGYQERWAEYRMKASRVVGNFNPDVTGSLSHWHLAEDFSSLPSLNSTFVRDATPMSRVTTVDTEPDFLLDLWFDYKCARPLPIYSLPSLTSRF